MCEIMIWDVSFWSKPKFANSFNYFRIVKENHWMNEFFIDCPFKPYDMATKLFILY
jgi:hypothetical protein